MTETERIWWKEAVVYQIYPRSFKDSNGDGIGDLRGIISRIDYISSLGVDVIWLNPIFSSPNDDNGYDISNYRDIMSDFGTMDDFDELIKGLHSKGIRLVLDLVVNHSSDEHPWFISSRSDRNSKYRDYYHWWPEEKGTPPHRFSIFDVDNDAWMYDETTRAWYLHYFSRKQPDLNWENPELREEIYDMMRFWFNKGVDGFRMDVISFISKDISFPETGFVQEQQFLHYYAKGPRLHEYLREMNREVLQHYDIMTVAEGAGVKAEDALSFVDPDRKELNMLYHFEGSDIRKSPDYQDPSFDLLLFKEVYSRWDKIYETRGWGTVYLGNHDQPRMVSRWGNDSAQFRIVSSKMLMTFLLSMRATPYFYAGDELAMANIRFQRIDDYNDLAVLNRYRKIMSEGGDPAEFLDEMMEYSRDNGRTPFQWSSAKHAGFTSAEPLLKVNPDYLQFNAEDQEHDPSSPLNYFRNLIQLRKAHPALIYGSYTLLDPGNTKVYSYSRVMGKDIYIVLLNFSSAIASFNIPYSLQLSTVLTSNYSAPPSGAELKPYEAAIVLLT